MMSRCKKIRLLNLIATLSVLFFFFSDTGWAGERDKVQKLPSIEVTGKRVKGLLRPGLTTNVINPEAKIEAGETNDITDLLRESQSILVQDSSYGKKVFLRGLEDQDMRILINGMPAGQMGTYYTRSFEWETIPVDAIDRIEVTKGVGSAEYGNTLAGTINIITKRGTERLKTRLRGSYGRYHDRKSMITNSGTYGPLDWFAGASYHKRNKYLKNNNIEDSNGFLSTGIDLGDLGEIRFTGYGYHKNEGYVLDDRVLWNIWSEARGYAEGSDFTLDNIGGEITYTSNLVDLGMSYSKQDRYSNPLKDRWKDGETDGYSSDFGTPSIRCKVHQSFGPHTLSLGGEFTYGDADAHWKYYNQGRETVYFNQDLWGAFFQDSWDILPRLNFTIGVRYDDYKNTVRDVGQKYTPTGRHGTFQDHIGDHQWSPRYTLTYRPLDSLSVYFTGGRIFKSPTMADTYRWYSNYSFISSPGRAVLRAYYGLRQPPMAPASKIPDRYRQSWQALIGKLRPIKGWDYELGIKQATDRFAYHINLFHQDIYDYINKFPVSYPPTYNINSLDLWGLELSGRYIFCRYLEIEGSYTYEDTKKHRDKLVERMYRGENDLANAPRHILNVTLRARPFRGFTAEWQTRYTAKRFAGGAPGVPPQMAGKKPEYQPMTYLGGYAIHNLRLSYETNAIHRLDTKFLLAIENITNKRTWERLDYPIPATTVYGGVQVEF